MTGNRDCFVSLDEKLTSQLKLGDSKLQSVQGKGIISVPTNNDKIETNSICYVCSWTDSKFIKCWLAY